MSRSSRRAAAYLVGLAITLAAVSVACLDWPAPQGALADDLPAPAQLVTSTDVDPARIEGHEKCIDCHAQEVKAWLASKHATRAFDLLRTSPTSRGYAAALGIRPSEIARKSICVSCHATPRQDHAGKPAVISGVSCEACHNASGGDDGWLNLHAVYGPRGTRREEESEAHFASRQANGEQAGQFRSSNAYHLVKRCFACHVVSDEALVEADHDHGDGFEVVEKMLGEVRHNFFLDRHQNADVATLWTDSLHHGMGRTAAGRKRVLFIVGQLVDLETSLRSLAKATEDNDFFELMFDRIDEAFGLMEDVLDELDETEVPEIESVVELVEPIFEKLDDDGFAPDDKNVYLDAAKKIAQVAEAFAARDGNKLAAIDDLLPTGPFEGVYEPGSLGEPDSFP